MTDDCKSTTDDRPPTTVTKRKAFFGHEPFHSDVPITVIGQRSSDWWSVIGDRLWGHWGVRFVGRWGQAGRWLTIALVFLVVGGCSRELKDLRAQVEDLLRQWHSQAALASLEWHLGYAPQDNAARLLRVRLLVHAGALDEALRDYQELWKIHGDPHLDLLEHILNAYLREEVESGGVNRLRAAPLVAHVGDPPVLPLLFELASSGDPAARSVAVEALSRLGLGPTLPFLTSLLQDPDPYARADAARGLGRLGADVARASLDPLLEDDQEVVRVAAAEGLARLGERRATPVLLQALRSRQASIRMQAAEVLGGLGMREAAPALLATLNDPDNYVRLYAAQALVRIGETEGLTMLHRALEHPSVSLRLFAAETLADLQDESPRPLLLQVVADPAMAKAVRLYAAWILGRLDDPSGIRYIGGLLQDADPYVRLRTAWTLGEIGHLEASFVLRSALRDVDRAVRIHAAWALNRLLRQRSRARG